MRDIVHIEMPELPQKCVTCGEERSPVDLKNGSCSPRIASGWCSEFTLETSE